MAVRPRRRSNTLAAYRVEVILVLFILLVLILLGWEFAMRSVQPRPPQFQVPADWLPGLVPWRLQPWPALWADWW